MSELLKFRTAKDKYLAEDPQSPLTDEQKNSFTLWCFVRPNGWHCRGAYSNLNRWASKISTVWEISLNLEGQEAELTVFVSPHGYFLPFIDSLAGKETYPAGRYLELEDLGNGHFLIDFNWAYNPYCAYNDFWSCPLTPLENRLNVPVRAGEKIFH